MEGPYQLLVGFFDFIITKHRPKSQKIFRVDTTPPQPFSCDKMGLRPYLVPRFHLLAIVIQSL
ncbi:MAG: hypothetical protein D6704_03105 [Nitrospirae bacterium]|nr:MAG: hypothetical protein D6704_03105 [Nitrospirota bacterium]